MTGELQHQSPARGEPQSSRGAGHAARGTPLSGRFARAVSALLSSAAALAVSNALAEPTPEQRALADVLFRDARKLMAEGRSAEACPKLEESERLAPAPGTLLNLGICHESTGSLVAAWNELGRAVAQAKRDGRADREEVAARHLAAVEKRLPRLVITVPDAVRVPDLDVLLGAERLAPATWGTRLPVDPGVRTIRAQAPGRLSWSRDVTIREGEVTTVTLEPLEPLPLAPPVTPPVTSVVTPSSPPPSTALPPPAPPPARPEASKSYRRPVGFALAGIGVVAVGVGSYFGLRALSLHGQAGEHCIDRRCSSEGVQLTSDARTAATLSNVFVGAGLAATIGGAFLIFGGKPSTTVGLVATPQALGASVGGGFL